MLSKNNLLPRRKFLATAAVLPSLLLGKTGSGRSKFSIGDQVEYRFSLDDGHGGWERGVVFAITSYGITAANPTGETEYSFRITDSSYGASTGAIGDAFESELLLI